MGKEDVLTSEERLLRLALRIAAVTFTVETLVYLVPALIGSIQPDWTQLPFVTNSVVKSAVLGGVCWVAGADVRRFSPVVALVILGTGGWAVIGMVLWAWGATGQHYTLLGADLSIGTIQLLGAGFEAGLCALFV